MRNKNVSNYLKVFDIFGKPVQLGLNGETSSKSIIGVFVSLVTIVLSLLMTLPTFENFIYEKNPILTRETVYGIDNITFDSSNFFVALSFYYKSSDNLSVKYIGNETNNLTESLRIYPVNYTCETCTGLGSDIYKLVNSSNSYKCVLNKSMDKSNSQSQEERKSECDLLSSYSISQIQGKSFKPTQGSKISSVSHIFNMVYCNKYYFNKDNTTINSLSKNKSNSIIDLFWTYSYCFPTNFSSLLRDEDDIEFKIQIPINNKPIEKPVMDGLPPEKPSKYPPGDKKGPDPSENIHSAGSSFPTIINQPSGNSRPPNIPNSPGSSKPDISNSSDPPQKPNNIQSPSNQPPIINQTNNISQPPSNSQLINVSQTIVPDSPPVKDDLTKDELSHILPMNLKNITQENTYPILLLLYKDISLNNHIVNDIFFLSKLDYKDRLTSNPISYSIYLYETVLTTHKSKFLSQKIERKSYFPIYSIVRDDLNSEENISSFLNFKVYPQKYILTLKYDSFSDVLSAFGSFFSVFSLICSIFSELYSDFIYVSDLINAVFKSNHFSSFEKSASSFLKTKDLKKEGLKKTISLNSSEKISNFINFSDKHQIMNTRYSHKNELFVTEHSESAKVNINNYLKTSEFTKSIRKKNEDLLKEDVIKETNINNFHDLRITSTNKGENKIRNPFDKFKELKNRGFSTSAFDIFVLRKFTCCVKNDIRFYILNRLAEVIQSFTQIESVIKNQIEVIFLRKILLTESQNMLFKYLFKEIDFNNSHRTLSFLNEIQQSYPDLDKEKVNKMNMDNQIDRYLLRKVDEEIYT